MKRYALCLGMDRVDPKAYDGWDGECPGCVLDASRFADLCEKKGFDGVIRLTNAAATKPMIRAAFEYCYSIVNPMDLLVLYNSGHGGQQPDESGDEDDYLDETLCWYDGEVLDDVIGHQLQLIPKGVRVLFISDTCNSGSNFRAKVDVSRPITLVQSANKLEASLLHFGGCSDGRSSYGDEDGGEFTNALLRTIYRAGSYRDWFGRICKIMPKWQCPTNSAWGPGIWDHMEAMT